MMKFKYFLKVYFSTISSKTIFLASLCLIYVSSFTANKALAQKSIERNLQALSILDQAIAAGGGKEKLSSIKDFTATGRITYVLAEPVIGNVTIKSHGVRHVKIEADLTAGKRTTIANGDSGSITEPDGRHWPIYRQSATDLEGLALPYTFLISAKDDVSTSVLYVGLVTRNGSLVHDIRIQKSYTQRQDPGGERAEREGQDFYIDAENLQIVAVSDQFHGSRNRDGIVHEILYSSYKSVSGFWFPLNISETVHGVTTVNINLNELTVNSGLSDSDFVR